MKEKEDDKKRCEDCGSTQTYLRVTTNDRYCRICGHVQIIKNKKDHGSN